MYTVKTTKGVFEKEIKEFNDWKEAYNYYQQKEKEHHWEVKMYVTKRQLVKDFKGINVKQILKNIFK